MMCAERVHQLIQAIILGMVMGMAAMGFAGERMMLQVAFFRITSYNVCYTKLLR